MGFEPERVEWALHSTGNSGLQSALDHLEANQDKPIPDYKSQPAGAGTGSGGSGDADYDDEEKAALMDMLKNKGQGAVDSATAGGEAKVSRLQQAAKRWSA